MCPLRGAKSSPRPAVSVLGLQLPSVALHCLCSEPASPEKKNLYVLSETCPVLRGVPLGTSPKKENSVGLSIRLLAVTTY